MLHMLLARGHTNSVHIPTILGELSGIYANKREMIHAEYSQRPLLPSLSLALHRLIRCLLSYSLYHTWLLSWPRSPHSRFWGSITHATTTYASFSASGSRQSLSMF